MPNATISNQTVTAALTQANVIAALKTRMAAAGWGLASETPGTSHVVWFSRVLNAGATYGTAFLRLTLNSTATSLSIATSYSTTGTLTTTALNPLTASTDLTIYSVNHPEVTGIILQQGTAVIPILTVRPANKPTWWNENAFLYAFLDTGGVIGMYGQPATHGLTGLTALAVCGASSSNPLNGSQHEIFSLAGVTCLQTFLGEFSSDVCYASRPSSIKATDTLIVTAGVEEYFVLDNFHAVRTI